MIALEKIERRIFLIRGRKVMLDSDLARLYGVKTFRLNEAVKRNSKRFPGDFMFRLTQQEKENLISQIAMSSWGGRRTPPYAFTELGVAMLSTVLNSERAIQVNIQIMRAFAKFRELLKLNKDLWRKIEEMEKKYDNQFKAVFDVLRQLIEPAEKPRRRMGFHQD